MMREDSKHRWRIEYCDTGKQEPDVYDESYNGNRPATIVDNAADLARQGRNGDLEWVQDW